MFYLSEYLLLNLSTKALKPLSALGFINQKRPEYLLEYLLMCDEISVKKVIDAAIAAHDDDAKKAISFLYKPATALGGKTPISLLDTTAGAVSVFELIVRLQRGMIS